MRLSTWQVVAVGLVLGLAGCGSDGDADANTGAANHQDASAQAEHVDAGQHDDGLSIVFSPMYSAYIDNDHPCRVPAIIRDAPGGVRWKASDDSMVELEPAADGGVLITTKRAGSVDIIATAGGLRGKATLKITAFSVEEWEAGNQRYHSDVEYVPPTSAEIKAAVEAAQMDADGGPVDTTAVRALLQPPAGAACTSCHGSGTSGLSFEYTPQQAGGLSDAELAAKIKSGEPPPSPSIESLPWPVLKQLHSDAANLDATQVRNLVAYMRSLAPK